MVSPLLELCEGNLASAEERWLRAVEHHVKAGNRYSKASFEIWLGILYRLRGDWRLAEERLLAALSVATEGPSLPLTIWPAGPLALLYCETGRAAEARLLLDRCQTIVGNGEDWRGLTGRVRLAQAAVLASEGRLSEAEQWFQNAVEVFRRFGLVWDEAEAYFIWGRALAKFRRRGAARGKFEQTLAVYSRVGAGPDWMERVGKELGALEGLPGKISGHPDDLTDREVEILRLVADGQSNRDIAAALVLSVRTVERHITNIYVKIGAHSKAQATAYALSRDIH